MRSLSSLAISALLTLGLGACQGSTPSTPAESTPPQASEAPAQEATPAADAPAGTESGGAKATDTTAQGEWKSFGEPYEAGDVIKAKDFLSNPSPHLNQEITLEGTVADVCQKAGCWMVISDGENQMRIRTKDHGFAVDKDSQGSWAQIRGKVVEIEISPEVAQHFKEESNRPDMAPESGKAETLIEIEASGVRLKKTAS